MVDSNRHEGRALLRLAKVSHASGVIELPGSKSISNRVLLLAAVAQGSTLVRGLLESDDTAVMIDSLQRLGVAIDSNATDGSSTDGRSTDGSSTDGHTTVHGCGGRLPIRADADLFIGNSGLTIRTLAPMVFASLRADSAAVCIRFAGVPRMHERPIGDLVDGLRALGAAVDYERVQGYPPLRIRSAPIKSKAIRIRGNTSSQYLTGLLQCAPLLAPLASDAPVIIDIEGELISRPYVEITLKTMAKFGVRVERVGWQRFVVASGQRYVSPGEIEVEGDASTASYFLAAGAIAATSQDPVRVQGVGSASVQGDVRFADALEKMGATVVWGENSIATSRPEHGNLRGITLDCNHIPDAAMTLAVLALHAEGTTKLTNIGSWRVKETDRIAAMATELRKLGALVDEGADWISVSPPAQLVAEPIVQIETYDDHRVAMCFALASLSSPLQSGVALEIIDPNCVAKTFPAYFERFHELTHPAPVITIDGPTASGKGTIAVRVATALGWHYLDSGALYRLLALAALGRGVALEDEKGLAKLASSLEIHFEGEKVWLWGSEVSLPIRAEDVGKAASKIAVFPSVRLALLSVQRAHRRWPGLVADGRDMGTVVFPQAQRKVFLTASAHARAERRHKQLIEKGFSANLDGLLHDLLERDERDTSRTDAPLKAAEDAVLLDTTSLGIDETVTKVVGLIQR
jgi:3-phosphoshikimate 1-carboxyvinyltransferase